MTSRDAPRVLLLWPGGVLSRTRSFGVPQMLSIAGFVRQRTGAQVDVVDLDFERIRGPVHLQDLVRTHYDVIGISCYSSYDYLKVMAIAQRLRATCPDAALVTGGYHPSACPDDFTAPDSPFDYVIIGDGELPMARLVESICQAKPPPRGVLPAEALMNLEELPPYDWQLLARYRKLARTVTSQAEIYLSRGCPFSCSFCMERAKRTVAWRAFRPARALEELRRLDGFLDLSGWTLFITDALFGLDTAWRKEVLEGLARRPLRARKLWLLVRQDLLDSDDVDLMARAHVAPGFGLESGSAAMLHRVQKSRRGEEFLDHMRQVASWCRNRQVPFGVNLIVGHPGETEQSIQQTGDFVREVFVEPQGNTGFVSVDPFRLYPGSTIAQQRDAWELDTGMRMHRYPWWHDGDQGFLSEWVDPSASLDFRRTLQLRVSTFGPLLSTIAKQLEYRGEARDYFLRAAQEQVTLVGPRNHIRSLGLWHLWRALTGADADDDIAQLVRSDPELEAAARAARAEVIRGQGPWLTDELRAALQAVPRERFVRLEDVALSAEDRALKLSDDGLSTISAMHAYAVSFQALNLGPGDHLVDLGGGTGYGAAIASQLVGPQGSVTCIEICPELAALARVNLAGYPNVTVLESDAHDTASWSGASKVSVGFALSSIPQPWLEALAENAVLVLPLKEPSGQSLVRVTKADGNIQTAALTAVRYVEDRAPKPAALDSVGPNAASRR